MIVTGLQLILQLIFYNWFSNIVEMYHRNQRYLQR